MEHVESLSIESSRLSGKHAGTVTQALERLAAYYVGRVRFTRDVAMPGHALGTPASMAIALYRSGTLVERIEWDESRSPSEREVIAMIERWLPSDDACIGGTCAI